jgi:hypothetical protein
VRKALAFPRVQLRPSFSFLLSFECTSWSFFKHSFPYFFMPSFFSGGHRMKEIDRCRNFPAAAVVPTQPQLFQTVWGHPQSLRTFGVKWVCIPIEKVRLESIDNKLLHLVWLFTTLNEGVRGREVSCCEDGASEQWSMARLPALIVPELEFAHGEG